jgi:alpha-D-ribose 1-methylphosphonate 5-triphosphate synthase subunit PhnH
VALALCDHDTPLWLDAALQASDAAKTWLGFHTGAPLAHNPAEAHFALVRDPAEMIALENFAQGTQEYPDRSATLILSVDSLTSGSRLGLRGPGIETQATISPAPASVARWRSYGAAARRSTIGAGRKRMETPHVTAE